MKLNKTQITAIKPGKRKKQYIVAVSYKDLDGKMGAIELTRDDIANIVKMDPIIVCPGCGQEVHSSQPHLRLERMATSVHSVDSPRACSEIVKR